MGNEKLLNSFFAQTKHTIILLYISYITWVHQNFSEIACKIHLFQETLRPPRRKPSCYYQVYKRRKLSNRLHWLLWPLFKPNKKLRALITQINARSKVTCHLRCLSKKGFHLADNAYRRLFSSNFADRFLSQCSYHNGAIDTNHSTKRQLFDDE